MNARKRSHKPTRSGRESSDQSLSSLCKWPTVQTFHKSANWNLKNRNESKKAHFETTQMLGQKQKQQTILSLERVMRVSERQNYNFGTQRK